MAKPLLLNIVMLHSLLNERQTKSRHPDSSERSSPRLKGVGERLLDS